MAQGGESYWVASTSHTTYPQLSGDVEVDVAVVGSGITDWNAAERSWDCPCHGSRYTGEGEMIQGPSMEDLRRIE